MNKKLDKMKHILHLLILSFFSFSAFAQVTINPDPVELSRSVDLSVSFSSVEMLSTITNEYPDEVQLKWNVTKIDGPEEWEIQVCDNNLCYAYGVPSNIDASQGLEDATVISGAGGTSILNPKVKPNGVAGCGNYQISLSFVSNPDSILYTGSYSIMINVDENCVPLMVNTEEFAKANVKIFPNPTTNFFQITDNEFVSDIEIFNIVGKRMTQARFIEGKPFDVSSFPNGLYLVRMIDEEGTILKTTRLTKR